MPQLDKTIIFTQIFWLFLIFTLCYIVLTHYFLPLFLKSLKSRKLIVDLNMTESKKVQDKFLSNQAILSNALTEGLSTLKMFYSNEFLFIKEKKIDTNLNSLDIKLVKIFLNIMLYSDKRVLNNISLNSRTYNTYCKSK